MFYGGACLNGVCKTHGSAGVCNQSPQHICSEIRRRTGVENWLRKSPLQNENELRKGNVSSSGPSLPIHGCPWDLGVAMRDEWVY